MCATHRPTDSLVERDPFANEASRREVYHRLKSVEEQLAVQRALDQERRETLERRFSTIEETLHDHRSKSEAEHKEQTLALAEVARSNTEAIAALGKDLGGKLDAINLDTAAERIKGRNLVVNGGLLAVITLFGGLIAKLLGAG